MAKELPYFEFEPAEYLSGNISFCSLESQGLFTLMCCYYWQRNCVLSKEQFLKRYDKPELFEELVFEKVIKLNDGFISISFLNEKLEKAIIKSNTNSINGSKGGRPKKADSNQLETENKPTAFNSLSETKGIREDKIIEEEIIQDKIKENDILLKKETKFNVSEVLIFNGAEKDLVKEWLSVRKLKKLANTKTAIDDFLNEVEKSNMTINEVLKKCIIKSWGGFKYSWVLKEQQEQQVLLPKKNHNIFVPGEKIQ